VADPGGGGPWVPWNPLSHESTADYVASYWTIIAYFLGFVYTFVVAFVTNKTDC